MIIIKKEDSLIMKLLNLLLTIVSFGQAKGFMTNYTTTFLDKVYVPSNWESWDEVQKDLILYHEQVHLDQHKNEGLIFNIKYSLLPFPLFWANYRLQYEIEAYCKESVYAYGKYGLPVLGRLEDVVEQLTSANYLWPTLDKKKVRVMFLETIKKEMAK